MKSILFSLVFLFVPKLCISQVITANDDAVYLDSLFNMGTEKNYKYIRVVKDYNNPNQKSYEVKDFYKSGQIAMSGTTTTRDKVIKNGMFVYYFENGNKKSIVNYKLDKPYGNYYELYENGNKKLDGEWTDEDKTVLPNIKIKGYWDENSIQTIKDGNGYYEGFYSDGVKELGKGKIINNLKDSTWVGENKKIKFTYTENYKNGELISGVSIDSNKVEHKYTVSEIRPIPKKGMDNFMNHIARTFNTPKVEGLKGKIYLTFVVEKDGSITDIKVLRDIGYGTGNEAVRVLKSYGNWIPGEQRGVKVRCTFSLPISVQTTR